MSVNGMVSIIIPARNEKYLKRTIQDLLEKAKGKVEVIAMLDGYWPALDEYVDDPRVTYVHFSVSRGMRNAINQGVAISQGEYILKIDAHCMVSEGFDETLKADCEFNWVVVPRRKRLKPDDWTLIEDGRPDISYMYLTYPGDDMSKGLHGAEWRIKNEDESLRGFYLDDLMSSQGSCWFMKRSYFDYLELMDEKNYGSFASEFQEIGLKCWLSGGSVKVNKKAWYGHWHKTSEEGGRGYSLDKAEFNKASDYVDNFMTNPGLWGKQTVSFKEFIKKFMPVPGWPEEYGK